MLATPPITGVGQVKTLASSRRLVAPVTRTRPAPSRPSSDPAGPPLILLHTTTTNSKWTCLPLVEAAGRGCRVALRSTASPGPRGARVAPADSASEAEDPPRAAATLSPWRQVFDVTLYSQVPARYRCSLLKQHFLSFNTHTRRGAQRCSVST